jgi:two-component system cell cycle sensor histidine kinase/response regulator CckA
MRGRLRTLSVMGSESHDARSSLYELAFENVPCATLVVDADGQVLLRNRAARALPEEWLDGLFAGPPTGAPEVDRFHREVAEHGHAYAETVVGRQTVALDGCGCGTLRIVTVDHVGGRRELEADPRTVRRIESLGHLTASLAHDFNNLLTPILSLSERLETELLSRGTARVMARDIRMAAERAAALVRETLRLVRREPTRVEPLSVNAVVRDLRSLIERVVGAAIDVELALSADACVTRVDRERLEHAVLNLAANARDAMPSGGRLTLTTATVAFDAGHADVLEGAAEGTYVALRVTDNGTGMTTEARERVFERFFTTKGEGGTGLGLCGVQRFVAESGGCLALHSERGLGTTLVLYLPLAAGSRARPLRSHPSPH